MTLTELTVPCSSMHILTVTSPLLSPLIVGSSPEILCTLFGGTTAVRAGFGGSGGGSGLVTATTAASGFGGKGGVSTATAASIGGACSTCSCLGVVARVEWCE